MASGKLTPRQKMINMMYLVLTALLALNVSTEVLNAFKLVNDGITNSNKVLMDKNTITYGQFADEMTRNAAKVKPFQDKALAAKKISDDLYNQIEAYKQNIVKQAEGYDPESGDLVRRDDIDIPTRIFVEQNGKEGKKLKQAILDARTKLLALIDDPAQKAKIEKSLTLSITEKKGVDWEFATFNHVPATAAVTTLTKFQNDVRASESSVIEELKTAINLKDYKFDQLTAAVVSPSGYILQGQTYKADIFVAASSSQQNPDIFIGGFTSAIQKDAASGEYKVVESKEPTPPLSGAQQLQKVENGKGKYETTGSAVGEKKYTGVIRVANPDGSGYKFYPFEGQYQVGAKAVVVAPLKMNVLYIGVPNPMKISVPGVSQNDVTATMTSGTLSKNPDGTYTAEVTAPGKTTINVSAKIEGKVQAMGSEEFRIKRIPNPIVTLGGTLRPGPATSGQLQAQSGLVPLLENFDFEARFNVQSFKLVYASKGEVFDDVAQGPRFTDKMLGFMKRAKLKDIILIDDIKVVGPDKTPRKLDQVSFQVK